MNKGAHGGTPLFKYYAAAPNLEEVRMILVFYKFTHLGTAFSS